MSLDKCLRCGECCITRYKGIVKECRYLRRAEGKTYCSIYDHRLGSKTCTIHNVNFYCIPRECTKEDYPDCPYNSGKPIRMQT